MLGDEEEIKFLLLVFVHFANGASDATPSTQILPLSRASPSIPSMSYSSFWVRTSLKFVLG